MKAAILKQFGSPLAIETLPEPTLGTGEVIVDVMAINGRRPSEAILQAYAEQHQDPVPFDLAAIRELGVTPFFGDIIAEANYVRHDARALAETIFRLYDRYGRTLERMRRTE